MHCDEIFFPSFFASLWSLSSNVRRPIWWDSLSDSEAVFLGSLVILGGFVAMGQRVKNTIDVCDLPYNRHTL